MKYIILLFSILSISSSVAFSQISQCDSLLDFITLDKTRQAKGVIDHRCDINCLSLAGSSPLGSAARRGNLEIVKYLLEKGADPNLRQVGKYTSGITPIFDAVFIYEQELEPLKQGQKRKYYDYNIKDEIVKLLISYGADVNMKDSMQNTPLMAACMSGRENIIKLLINENTDINNQNDYGYTALMQAAYKNHYKIVKILLEAGANILLKNNRDETALDIAEKANNIDIICLLQEYR